MKTFSELVEEWGRLPDEVAGPVAGYFLGALDAHLRHDRLSKRFIRTQLHLAVTKRDELLATLKRIT